MIHHATPPIRYSPRPLTEYRSEADPGPAGDTRVDRESVWNLAYLSFDFDKKLRHPDRHFLTNVRKTCQFDYMRGEIDLTFNSRNLVASHLLMPAPWFIKWLSNNKSIAVKLPMYEAYGPSWLMTIEQRARSCHTHDHTPEQPIKDVGAAVIELRRVMRR